MERLFSCAGSKVGLLSELLTYCKLKSILFIFFVQATEL